MPTGPFFTISRTLETTWTSRPRAGHGAGGVASLSVANALLVYQCAFGDWFAIARGAHDPPAACRLRPLDGLFISLLSRTLDGARLMLLCLP